MKSTQPLTWLLAGLLPLASLHASEHPAALAAIEARGATVVGSFDAPGGLKGYAARYQGQGVALYLTPDGEHVLAGSLFDAKGQDLSQAPLDRLVYEPLAQQMWSRLQATTWIADGDPKAPRILYVFSDPNCPYCNLFWNQSRPWVDAGKVQLRHVMVGLIRADSSGKSAALLSARDPKAALHAHESAGKASTLKPLATIPQSIQKQLAEHTGLMKELGTQATPAIFYLDDQGRLQQQQGAPRPEALAQLLGPLAAR